MFPYIAVPKIPLGFTTVSVFNLLVIVAVCVGFRIVWVRSRFLGINKKTTAWAISGIILTGFVISHIFEIILYHPKIMQRDPAELLWFWRTMSSYGGITGGLLGAIVIMKYFKLSKDTQLGFIDCFAFVAR
jgi:phosphatidylglycerol:prolipoprotein diacylglycerol transferase